MRAALYKGRVHVAREQIVPVYRVCSYSLWGTPQMGSENTPKVCYVRESSAARNVRDLKPPERWCA
jgi:hypothetical protein